MYMEKFAQLTGNQVVIQSSLESIQAKLISKKITIKLKLLLKLDKREPHCKQIWIKLIFSRCWKVDTHFVEW